MRVATYGDLARRFALELCVECDLPVHGKGWVDIPRGRIHWRERRVNRLGLRRFLMLAAEVSMYRDGYRGGSEAERLWMLNTWAYREAMQLGMRLGRELSRRDRARVLYLLRDRGQSAAKRWAKGS